MKLYRSQTEIKLLIEAVYADSWGLLHTIPAKDVFYPVLKAMFTNSEFPTIVDIVKRSVNEI